MIYTYYKLIIFIFLVWLITLILNNIYRNDKYEFHIINLKIKYWYLLQG